MTIYLWSDGSTTTTPHMQTTAYPVWIIAIDWQWIEVCLMRE